MILYIGIEEGFAKAEEYIEHRLKREKQIVASLQTGEKSRESTSNEVYLGLDERLKPLARENILVRLEKLIEEGVVQTNINDNQLYSLRNQAN